MQMKHYFDLRPVLDHELNRVALEVWDMVGKLNFDYRSKEDRCELVYRLQTTHKF
jgi:hypothetical protein